MKFSIRLNNDHPVKDYVHFAKLAEATGFDQFWVSDDLFLRSAPIILTAVAGATDRIEIGTCIVNPYTINPAEIAMIAATLDEASNYRFNLGLSAGSMEFLKWIGIKQVRPHTAVVESAQAINRLFNGEDASIEGNFLNWKSEAYLRFKPKRRVPIYIGAMSPKMLRSIGEIADGGLPLLFPPEHYQNTHPYIDEGIEQAGRNHSEVDVAACIWCSISDDREQAEAVMKEKIAYYGHALSPMILEQLKLTKNDFAAIEHMVMAENNLAMAAALVTDKMMQIGIAGSTKELIPRLEKLVAMGAKHISFGPPLGPDISKAIVMLGQQVIPYFWD